MPIYEYECPKCGKFEVVQKADARPLKAKPDCDIANCPKKATRLISAAAFHLKGSGWYKTDYASPGKSGTGASAPKGDVAKTEGVKAETKIESGSDASAEKTGSQKSDSAKPEGSTKSDSPPAEKKNQKSQAK